MSKKLSTQEKARRLWVRALRSGKYKWGKGKLRTSDGGYCCLGVLCEVAVEQGVIKDYLGEVGNLRNHPSVMKWVGLRDRMGYFSEGSLAFLNDDAKRNPFAKIATLIERKPRDLFVDEEEA